MKYVIPFIKGEALKVIRFAGAMFTIQAFIRKE
jgi:hypothetical protein